MTDDNHASCNHSSHGGHGHHHHGPAEGPLLWVSLGVTLTFVVGEGAAGLIGHSLALLSDSGHNLSDALSLGLAAYALWVARKPANARKTFGYHRVAILTALFNAFVLVLIGLGILGEAWQAFQHPRPVNGLLMIIVAGIALVINTGIAGSLSGHVKDSLNMRAAFIHMLGDALSSVGVVLAGIAVKLTGWYYADPLVSLLIGVFILYSSWGILRDAADILLEGTPKGLNVSAMVAGIQRVNHVQAVHDLHIWTVSDNMNFLSCHVEVADTQTMAECAVIVRQINEMLAHDYGIAHATIQTEAFGCCETGSETDPLYCHEGRMRPASVG